jgi:dolichol-phosphate mannosyltransferase
MPGPPWLILPTYNEAENLEAVVSAARTALTSAAPEGFRIVVVDDDSPDGTGAIADRLAAAHPDEIEVLHRTARTGLAPAYLAGFARALDAGAGFVCEMDADLSHDPADLPRLLDAARDGAGLALGSRYVDGGGIADWGPVRRGVSRGGSWYARRVLGVGIRDLTGGYKCYRAEVLRAIDLATVRSHGYAFQVELTYRTLCAGFEVVEVPIVFRDRRRGESKMSWRIALEAAWLVPALRHAARGAVHREAGRAQARAAARRSDA